MLDGLSYYSAGSGCRVEPVVERLIASQVNRAHHRQAIEHILVDSDIPLWKLHGLNLHIGRHLIYLINLLLIWTWNSPHVWCPIVLFINACESFSIILSANILLACAQNLHWGVKEGPKRILQGMWGVRWQLEVYALWVVRVVIVPW